MAKATFLQHFLGMVLFLPLFGYICAGFELPSGIKHEDYCKGCEETVQAILKLNADPGKDMDSSSPCLKRYLLQGDMDEKTYERTKRVCNHIIDLHFDEMVEKVGYMNEKQLNVWLCRERTHACLGLVHEKFYHKDGFDEDEEIRKLIEANKDRVKRVNPRSHHRDEL